MADDNYHWMEQITNVMWHSMNQSRNEDLFSCYIIFIIIITQLQGRWLHIFSKHRNLHLMRQLQLGSDWFCISQHLHLEYMWYYIYILIFCISRHQLQLISPVQLTTTLCFLIAAQVITMARAVYDEEAATASSRFVGVVAIDISYDHIKQVSS